MLIYKNSKVGGEGANFLLTIQAKINKFVIFNLVKPHQDATYFHCDPIESITGFWIPTADATLENGCLYFIKGSHKKGLYSRYVYYVSHILN